MLEQLIGFSIRNKLIIALFTTSIVGFGIYALLNIPIGAVPDITNNQVQVITTSRNLSTQDVEQFITYPVELEMANLPGVKEIRSISKFGLSVVTIVFEDRMGTYLPRQLIAEKIKSAEENIPAGFGSPFMGPVSTGLGEIYQYILDVEPEYADQYSPMELRTIQDWIVRRQLSGIPGVVEVNTWGGFLKQYEVAVNPEKLKGANLTVAEVYAALEMNNNVAGGGYIERTNESYFIRGEGLVGSIQDIENIVVANREGIPVYVRDIARVGFGSATRFGAITGNGEGEKVLGQVMMLKDANSKAVIDRVKERVAAIQHTLPEGVFINPFLERSELIGKTTFTITENLVLGCLIVIFVVVILLGNLRSGLVVASVIPLSLLFALSLMYIFGVDANLMSLGAIDFGIIIDGAVIIVEYIAYKITARREEILALDRSDRQEAIDSITLTGANKMMRSAIFGQLIIMIVFIPILSLADVEGKMFRPMALTFCFALLGAMILCFTYVPMISAVFLKPAKQDKKNISKRIMGALDRLYTPVIRMALNARAIVIALAILLLVVTGIVFSRMGGEFVPTLDEGDFVIQPVLKTGTSLGKTVELTTQMEKVLKTFPEVRQVVTRIGAAEVPTDPMSMEESDVIITLIPKSEWTTAETKDELAEKFKEALSILPGIEYEFTQPIEMRFNELITGVRADLAIKIFGQDLDLLYEKGLEVKNLIENVPGAADITLEKTAGLPQMSVRYDRASIARYGLNVADLNRVISMGFAGLEAGSVFEGEKQFDLVIRFEEDFRDNIDHLRNTYVPLPGGGQIPLRELAEIKYTKGPAKISRDDTRRRIVVGVNVRNRDLESVVEDVQALIEEHIRLPTGYEVTYGGQFENLRAARQRLLIAVPVALVLIFILLHFAFQSLKEALMVYTAIPLSSVGGVFLLWFRDMPFSISAGVGFIALFGIAVLNGIVLIEHFKELKHQGMDDIKERVITGTRQRLRPVLLTASAAALGFLPMAISTSAGAEVQRPLATVVVGGLITATLLTLIVLPVLYSIFDSRRPVKMDPKAITAVLFIAAMSLAIPGQAQESVRINSLEEAISLAEANNRDLQVHTLKIEQQTSLLPSAFELEKTHVYYNFDQNNIAPNGFPLKVWGIQQNIPFPTIFGLQKELLNNQVELARQEYAIARRSLSREVAKAYYQIVYLQHLAGEYQALDTLYANFARSADRRFELGETNYLERLTAQTQQQEIRLMINQNQQAIAAAYLELNRWIQTDRAYRVTEDQLSPMAATQRTAFSDLPGFQYYQKGGEQSLIRERLARQKLLPDLQLEYFQGSNQNREGPVFRGFQVGLSVPIWFKAQKARAEAATVEGLWWQAQADNFSYRLEARQQQLLAELEQHRQALDFYNENGATLAAELQKTAERSFREGEIDFFQYILSLDKARKIEIDYLHNLYQYNLIVLEINYITN
ncbi:CusA/CzcA family heavy metal efflux RND transporter [Flavilitoribacter nigricans]|uniref:CusA/CzcA family heavy metal efflux RND transporter n=1 Tax=Flavilitoribacter nigricans (strain ATCC 23147 / DSM 23189 / NBRC 102662 / NCIMB 1420 / SS-2) TaxID=1122177 RepID=A0A2D0NDA1_FLAN2|nr:CusA/CzcA family heavy metal efflux RND transporter [Flavilitoribacter nigricans]PHN06491.1 CusA/CzcA family heavy metal efflux RND transporter [Flavilitoribacter nigricans DSM 23189 = NBRC 102662]